MKKFLTVLLCIVTIIACALPMAGCSLFAERPEMDLELAKENLLDNSYVITSYIEHTSYDSIAQDKGISSKLVAYKESDNVRYSIQIYCFGENSLAKAYYKQLKAEQNNTIDYYTSCITYYENYLDHYGSHLTTEGRNSLKDQIKEYKEKLERLNDVVIGRKGDCVWQGYIDAIKATKGE